MSKMVRVLILLVVCAAMLGMDAPDLTVAGEGAKVSSVISPNVCGDNIEFEQLVQGLETRITIKNAWGLQPGFNPFPDIYEEDPVLQEYRLIFVTNDQNQGGRISVIKSMDFPDDCTMYYWPEGVQLNAVPRFEFMEIGSYNEFMWKRVSIGPSPPLTFTTIVPSGIKLPNSSDPGCQSGSGCQIDVTLPAIDVYGDTQIVKEAFEPVYTGDYKFLTYYEWYDYPLDTTISVSPSLPPPLVVKLFVPYVTQDYASVNR